MTVRQSTADRLRRLNEGSCPVHGLWMGQVDGWFYPEDEPPYTVVSAVLAMTPQLSPRLEISPALGNCFNNSKTYCVTTSRTRVSNAAHKATYPIPEEVPEACGSRADRRSLFLLRESPFAVGDYSRSRSADRRVKRGRSSEHRRCMSLIQQFEG